LAEAQRRARPGQGQGHGRPLGLRWSPGRCKAVSGVRCSVVVSVSPAGCRAGRGRSGRAGRGVEPLGGAMAGHFGLSHAFSDRRVDPGGSGGRLGDTRKGEPLVERCNVLHFLVPVSRASSQRSLRLASRWAGLQPRSSIFFLEGPFIWL